MNDDAAPDDDTADTGDEFDAVGDASSGLIAPEAIDDFWDRPSELEPVRESWHKRAIARTWVMISQHPVEGFISFFVVGVCVIFTYVQIAAPFQHGVAGIDFTWFGTVFDDNTPAGGDMGAHVWGPAYLRDHLLTQGRLTGWTPDWYAGMPAYGFYMVLPSLVIALLSLVIPYGIAFKLVAISGVLSLPVAVYYFGKLVDLPFPAPPLMAVGATVFLFDRSFSIYGGNIPSTLAGEFAFSISLSFAVLYLGVLLRGLKNGRHRGWAALLLALTGLCHLIPFIFVLACTLIALGFYVGVNRRQFLGVGLPLLGVTVLGLASFLRPSFDGKIDLKNLRWDFVGPEVALAGYELPIGLVVAVAAILAYLAVIPGWRRHLYWLPVTAVGGMLSAFWTVPFYLQHSYMNDMGWEKRNDPYNMLLARETMDGGQMVNSPMLVWVLGLAAAGLLLSIIWSHRGGLFLGATALAMGLMFVLVPEGRLWNARLLPFYYLSVYLLAAIGIAEAGRLVSLLFARDINAPIRGVQWATAAVGSLVAAVVIALPLHLNISVLSSEDASGTYELLGLTHSEAPSYIPSWSEWNFAGYENKPAYPEYRDTVETMANLGEERGCGRAMWEHEPQHDRYGTPMALMLLPFWTDSCITSMEGLYFESSSTTPYHFINQDELSSQPSNAQRDLPYGPGAPTSEDFDRGIDHLQMLGVRYYMAISDDMKSMADNHPDLLAVAETGPWVVYELTSDNELVEPLEFEPAVVTGLDRIEVPLDTNGKEQTGSPWQFISVPWYMDELAWDAFLADDGPETWQRVTPGDSPALIRTEPVEVTNIDLGLDSISFDVDEVGQPVLVKMSYFPNWRAAGAEGPWRVTPNLMVVVPTEQHVELSYGYAGVDFLGWALTLVGLVGVIFLFRLPALDYRDPGIGKWSGVKDRPWMPTQAPAGDEIQAGYVDTTPAELPVAPVGEPVATPREPAEDKPDGRPAGSG